MLQDRRNFQPEHLRYALRVELLLRLLLLLDWKNLFIEEGRTELEVDFLLLEERLFRFIFKLADVRKSDRISSLLDLFDNFTLFLNDVLLKEFTC